MSSDLLANALSVEAGLDTSNDIEYLLALVGEALRDDEHFADDRERAEWAVAEWCQNLQFQPDLRDFEDGQQVPKDADLEDLETAQFREAQENAGEGRASCTVAGVGGPC